MPRRAFTLVEMMVVIGIIGVLLSIVLPALGVMRRGALNSQCLSNLRQLYLPISSYMSTNKSLVPSCEFLPAASDVGPPVGGLPALLSGFLDPNNEAWKCPADLDDQSLATGTSYFYLPGLLKYAPQVQVAVLQMMLNYPPGSINDKERERLQHELESRLVTKLIEGDQKGLYPLLLDSQDRHGSGRNPRNGVFLDGSVRDLLNTVDNQAAD